MGDPLYPRIYAVARQVPPGKVVSYGQIAKVVGGCTARMVGYAMAALRSTREFEEVPWQRVINSQGKCSVFGDGFGDAIQHKLLEEEGIRFDEQGRVSDPKQWWIERPF